MQKEDYAIAGIATAIIIAVAIIFWATGNPWRVCELMIEFGDGRSGLFMFFVVSFPKAVSLAFAVAGFFSLLSSNGMYGRNFLSVAIFVAALVPLAFSMWAQSHYCVAG